MERITIRKDTVEIDLANLPPLSGDHGKWATQPLDFMGYFNSNLAREVGRLDRLDGEDLGRGATRRS